MTLNFAGKLSALTFNKKNKTFWTGIVDMLIGLLVWASVLQPLLVAELTFVNVVYASDLKSEYVAH